jgi:hypothetical protein
MKKENYTADLGARNAARSSIDSPGQTAKFIDNMPTKKFYDQALYIDKTLLPEIEKRRGKKSADYQFFSEVFKSLLYAIAILDRYQTMDRRIFQQQQQLDYFKNEHEHMTRELQKYCTLEDIFFSDGLDRYAEIITQRAADLLQQKTKHNGTDR